MGMDGGSNPPGATFLTGLTTGESRTVKKNWKSVQILGRTLGRRGFAGGQETGGDSLNTRKNQDESIVVLLKTVPESEEIAFNRART